jgi:hypothetical protein
LLLQPTKCVDRFQTNIHVSLVYGFTGSCIILINCTYPGVCSRFVLNAPEEELRSFERILFYVEQAHWFYEDYTMEQNQYLKSLTLREFTSLSILWSDQCGVQCIYDRYTCMFPWSQSNGFKLFPFSLVFQSSKICLVQETFNTLLEVSYILLSHM